MLVVLVIVLEVKVEVNPCCLSEVPRQPQQQCRITPVLKVRVSLSSCLCGRRIFLCTFLPVREDLCFPVRGYRMEGPMSFYI